ncbi:glycosyltransferase [Flaviflagellibacter deserti]|uniref:Glycosyltransferase n=1 Tax=Flaviflagellibacter deserti TaxID=2267266 RepID=A0ABV9Z4M5_9HYPH
MSAGHDLTSAYDLLTEQGTIGFIAMFWYVLIFEIPRYGLSIVAYAAGRSRKWRHQRNDAHPTPQHPKISVLVVGHNEESAITRCVLSLRAQSLRAFELILISDGSSDRMSKVAASLVAKGLADKAFSTDLRCGKSAGVNLAIRMASGDILVNVDCDCSYDRFAIESIAAPFADPKVGAVSGDILPRNGNRSLIAGFQVIEYLVTISLGKRIAEMFGLVVCASGAFAAFRRSALTSVGGIDVGGGEDLDITLRLRAKGWKIDFAPGALCYTDVPETAWGLLRQRLRWERDAVRLRYRKHRRLSNPLSRSFNLVEATHQVDFLFFHIILAVAFPLYLLHLYVQIGEAAIPFLIAVQLGLMCLDAVIFVAALEATNRWVYAPYLLLIPGYGVFSGLFMRLVRVLAYVQEWCFDASRTDNYVPQRVRFSRRW